MPSRGSVFMPCITRLPILFLIRCVACVYLIVGLLITTAAALEKANKVDISYLPPKDAAHQSIAALLKERRVLEQLQRIVSPIRLPRTLTLTFAGCDGESNALYDNNKVQVCYEMVDEIVRKAPKEKTAVGIEASDAIVGSLLFLFLHEISHALFDMLDVPIFGGE